MSEYLLYLVNVMVNITFISILINQFWYYTGKINLALPAFYLVGGFSYINFINSGYEFWIAIGYSLLILFLFNLIFFYYSYSFNFDKFSIFTITLISLVSNASLYWVDITGGAFGIYLQQIPEVFGYSLSEKRVLLLFQAILIFITFGLLKIFSRSIIALTIRANNQNPKLYSHLGINNKYKEVIFNSISHLLIVIPPFVAISLIFNINYTQGVLTRLIVPLGITLITGLNKYYSLVLASVLYIGALEATRFITVDVSLLGPIREILSGVMLLAVIWWRTHFDSRKIFT